MLYILIALRTNILIYIISFSLSANELIITNYLRKKAKE